MWAGKFILIIVWAIKILTSCFMHRWRAGGWCIWRRRIEVATRMKY